MYKDKKCANPCPETCPAQKCEEIDKNGDGDIIDETDYKCVLAVAAASAAAAPIAYGSQTAAAVGGVILGDTLSDSREPECCELLPAGTPDSDKDFTPCTKKNPNGCCPPKYSCNKGVCCAPNEIFVDGWMANYCDSASCPPNDTPDKTQKCPGTAYNSCCLPSPAETCGTFNVQGGGTYGYCKKTCPAGTVDECGGLCCQTGYTCKTEYGISKCIPDAPESCLPPDEYFCSGQDKYEPMKKCCLKGELCLHHPNGYPFCLDTTKL